MTGDFHRQEARAHGLTRRVSNEVPRDFGCTSWASGAGPPRASDGVSHVETRRLPEARWQRHVAVRPQDYSSFGLKPQKPTRKSFQAFRSLSTLRPYATHGVFADRPFEKRCKRPTHSPRVGAGQISASNQRVGPSWSAADRPAKLGSSIRWSCRSGCSVGREEH